MPLPAPTRLLSDPTRSLRGTAALAFHGCVLEPAVSGQPTSQVRRREPLSPTLLSHKERKTASLPPGSSPLDFQSMEDGDTDDHRVLQQGGGALRRVTS